MFSTMLSLLGSLRRGNFVTNSLRFRSSASAFLSRTFVTPTSSTVFTWSGWVKRGNLGVTSRLFGASTTTNFGFNSSDQLLLTLNGTAAVTTAAAYRDPSAWYHIVYAQNGAAQTLYVNGSSVGTGTTANTIFNTAIAHQLGAANTTNYFDGYLTEVHFIDGQSLTPSSFGQIESTTGVWSPKQYVGTYGINGFYLKFSNATSLAALGADNSGNGNTWAVNGVSLTPGVSYDSMLDAPVNYSDNGNGRGNYAVLNPLKNGGLSISNANLTVNQATASWANTRSTLQIPVGSKFYCEFVSATNYTANNVSFLGLANQSLSLTASAGDVASVSNATTASGDVLGLAVDRVNHTYTTYRNNTQVGTGLISATADLEVVVGCYQAGGSVNFGQRPFAYTPPSGFLALNTQNMPTPTIVNGASYIAATAYTGTAGVQSLSNVVNGVSFQPDFVWIKSRTPDTSNHALFDSVRGIGKYLSSNTTGEEVTNANTLTAFNSDGFNLGTDTTIVNANGTSYIAWQWKESVTAGLDVVAYTGTGVTRTVSHNLGVAPTFIIVKRLQVAGTSFQVRHPSIDVGNTMRLNLTDEFLADATIWGGSLPNASNFTVGTNASVNGSGSNYIAYCFAEVEGFSKFGNYIGNGSTNGPFVYCGFKPKFVIYKSFSGGDNSSWQIFDSTRDVFNPTDENLSANSVTNNTSGPYIDILSNGFKLRTASTGHNALNVGYIFVAFAEVPSKYALAR